MIQYVCKLHWVACTSHRLTNSELLALRPLESILWGRQPPTTLGNLTDPWSGVHHLFVERDVNVSFSGSGTLQSLKQSKAVSDPMDVSSPIGMAGGLPFRGPEELGTHCGQLGLRRPHGARGRDTAGGGPKGWERWSPTRSRKGVTRGGRWVKHGITSPPKNRPRILPADLHSDSGSLEVELV